MRGQVSHPYKITHEFTALDILIHRFLDRKQADKRLCTKQ
jgi:hypothetical protein